MYLSTVILSNCCRSIRHFRPPPGQRLHSPVLTTTAFEANFANGYNTFILGGDPVILPHRFDKMDAEPRLLLWLISSFSAPLIARSPGGVSTAFYHLAGDSCASPYGWSVITQLVSWPWSLLDTSWRTRLPFVFVRFCSHYHLVRTSKDARGQIIFTLFITTPPSPPPSLPRCAGAIVRRCYLECAAIRQRMCLRIAAPSVVTWHHQPQSLQLYHLLSQQHSTGDTAHSSSVQCQRHSRFHTSSTALGI